VTTPSGQVVATLSAMKQARTAAAKAKRTAPKADPRFAAFARLLARHAARRDFAKEFNDGALPQSQAGGYDSGETPGD